MQGITLEHSNDSLDMALRALCTDKDGLTLSTFIQSLKKYQIVIIEGVETDSPDYETCCTEVYKELLSKCDIDQLHTTTNNQQNSIDSPRAKDSKQDKPDYLNFVSDSGNSPFEPASEIRSQANAEPIIPFDQLRDLYMTSPFLKTIVDHIKEMLCSRKSKHKRVIKERYAEDSGNNSHVIDKIEECEVELIEESKDKKIAHMEKLEIQPRNLSQSIRPLSLPRANGERGRRRFVINTQNSFQNHSCTSCVSTTINQFSGYLTKNPDCIII